ncbi:hypothetical protein ACI8AF_06550 [Blastococcus sp. SYSU D00669]
MRTYDPADSIRYVHVATTVAAGVPPVEHRLPRGYADQSPRTRLPKPPARRPGALGARQAC